MSPRQAGWSADPSALEARGGGARPSSCPHPCPCVRDGACTGCSTPLTTTRVRTDARKTPAHRPPTPPAPPPSSRLARRALPLPAARHESHDWAEAAAQVEHQGPPHRPARPRASQRSIAPRIELSLRRNSPQLPKGQSCTTCRQRKVRRDVFSEAVRTLIHSFRRCAATLDVPVRLPPSLPPLEPPLTLGPFRSLPRLPAHRSLRRP